MRGRLEHGVPVVFAGVVLVLLLTRAPGACSLATPCEPDPVRWIAGGALAAPVPMVYLHRWAAAVAAGCCAVLWLAAFPGWPVLLVWAYAAVVIAVARRRGGPAGAPVARRRPARPAALPVVARPALGLAAAVLAVSAAVGAGVLWRQAGAQRQQDRAPIVAGVVTARLADGVRVALAGGGTADVAARLPADYPVGAAVRVWADDTGLRRLRSEPYDVTPGLAFAVTGVGVAGALLARVRQRRRELRLFFATPQPVRAARAVDDVGYVHVLVPATDHRTAVEFGIDVTGGTAPAGEPVTVPATLYGEPAPGRWCAVEVDGRLRVPTAPVGGTAVVPYDALHAVPQEVTDDDEQVVDPGQLSAYDRDAAGDEVHEHRISPARAWLETAVIGLAGALLGGYLPGAAGLSGRGPLVAAVAAGAALGLEYGWRARLRQRLRWDVGGVAAVGFRGRDRQPWTVDSAALADGTGAVTLIAGDAVITVEAPRPWPPGTTQRTADQLVAALRFAQRRALAAEHAPPPPEITPAHRPPLLYAVWVATVAVAAFAVH